MALPILAGVAVRALAGYVGKKLVKRSILKTIKKEGRDSIIKNRLPSKATENKILKEFKKEGPEHFKKMQDQGVIPKQGSIRLNNRDAISREVGARVRMNPSQIKATGEGTVPSNKTSFTRAVKKYEGNTYIQNKLREMTISKNEMGNEVARIAKQKLPKRLEKVQDYKIKKSIQKNAPKVTGVAIGAGMATYAKNADLSQSKAPMPSYMKKVKNKEFLK